MMFEIIQLSSVPPTVIRGVTVFHLVPTPAGWATTMSYRTESGDVGRIGIDKHDLILIRRVS